MRIIKLKESDTPVKIEVSADGNTMAILADRSETIKPTQNDMAEDSEEEDTGPVRSTVVLLYDLREDEEEPKENPNTMQEDKKDLESGFKADPTYFEFPIELGSEDMYLSDSGKMVATSKGQMISIYLRNKNKKKFFDNKLPFI